MVKEPLKNNKHVSTCQSCKGATVLDCSNCSGTGLKNPHGLNLPHAPTLPISKPIPVFGPMPNFRARV